MSEKVDNVVVMDKEKNKIQKNKSKAKGHIIAAVLTVVIFLIADYVMLFPYNIQSPTTWGVVIGVIVLFVALDSMLTSSIKLDTTTKRGGAASVFGGEQISFKTDGSSPKYIKYLLYTAGALVAIIFVLNIYSSTVFHAKTYAALAGDTIEERNFIEDFEPSENIDNIALMDTESAQIIGSRALGSLSDLVSQFEISSYYTQINLGGVPKKVTPLEFDGLFKWFANKDSGIPGYISVDPVENTGDFVELENPLYYAESAYFGEDLMRKLRFDYRWAMFDNVSFEIGEDGKAYYVATVIEHTIGLFGGKDVKGAVILDASSGETQYYEKEDIPSWVDIVYDGYLLTERYDWYGLLSGGFFNSIFANVDCKRVSADFGYKMFDDDVWVFTGVTSLVSDQSNIGFVLMNSRTGEIRYYAIPGAEEYSVMHSAEGEVQNLGYTASFPSVVNIDDQPTYIMVLKDKGGLVKQYALIHVERYNIVVTATTQREAITKYRAALSEAGLGDPNMTVDDPNSVNITIKDVKYVTVDGNSWVYLVDSQDVIYKMLVSQDETIVRVNVGDKIEVSFVEEDNAVRTILSFE